MKKLMTVLVILVSFFLFYNGFVQISLHQYTQINNLYSTIAATKNFNIVPIDIIWSQDEYERERQFNYFSEYLNSNSYYCIAMMKSPIPNTVANYIYAPDEDTLSMINIQENKRIDFSKPTSEYFSTDLNDSHRFGTIDFINQKYFGIQYEKIQFKQMSQYIKEWTGNSLGSLYFLGENLIEADLNDFKLPRAELSTSSLSIEPIDYSFLSNILIYIFVSLFLCSICLLYKSKREIMIRKIHGMSNFDIFKYIFLKDHIIYVLIYLSILIISYGIFVHNFRMVNLPLWKYMVCSIFLFFSCILVNSFIIILFLRVTQDLTYIKQNENIRLFTYGSYFLKVIFLISIFSPFIELSSFAKDKSYDGLNLLFHDDEYKDYIKLDSINVNMFSQDDFLEKEETLRTLFKKYDYIYLDCSEIYMTNNGEKYPIILLNQNALKKLVLKSVNKDDIRYVPGSYYVPKQLKQEWSSESFQIIDSGYSVYTIDLISSTKIKDPILYLVDDDDYLNPFYFFILDRDKSIMEQINLELQHANMHSSFSLTSTNREYYYKYSTVIQYCIDSFLLLSIYGIVIFIFQIQSLLIYLSENRKRIGVDSLFGKSIFMKYREIYIFNIFSYVLCAILLFVMKYDIKTILIYIMIIGIFDFIFIQLYIYFYQKYRLLTSLKGDQI